MHPKYIQTTPASAIARVFTRKVLITGGAGSLGREFVRYLYDQFPETTGSPYRLYDITVVDNNEWAVAELRHEFPGVYTLLGDVRDFPELGPYDYVIVCHAYKHVDLAESNVFTAVKNNLSSLIGLYDSLKGAGQILYISTDKAVEPVSTYGATKYLAEKLTWQIKGQVARCGNFLHSSGSVIPVWEKAITEGKPVPITDERMVRYVSNMDEAVKEIWEQFLVGEKLIIPKVRKVRIMDLLTEVLKKHGYMSASAYEPGVTVIGMRPGEKLEEKLKWDHE